jgi:transposase
MKLHGNARLSPRGRLLLCERVLEQGWSLATAAEAAGVSERTAGKWIGRYRTEGEAGLLDRPSAPLRVANRTDERSIEVVAALRRLRMTGAEIAETLGMALSTVSGILTRIGMGKLGRIGLEPARRYERARPGELLHVDVKKLGRIKDGAGKRISGTRRHWPLLRPTPPASAASNTAGSMCTSRSMTPPAWRMSRFSRMRKPRPRSDSFVAPSSTTPPTASLWSDSSPITGPPTSQPRTRSPVVRSGSAISAPGPTDPRPTARPVS